jgi:hypothetical protein
MIGVIVRQLIGLFVDDEFLAAAILVAVAVATAMALSHAAPAWLAGLLLTLAASIVLSVWRARRPQRGG